MNDIEEYCPDDKQDWRKWLELNRNKKEAVWLIFYKKKSSNFNLDWSESVDEALCLVGLIASKDQQTMRNINSISANEKQIVFGPK